MERKGVTDIFKHLDIHTYTFTYTDTLQYVAMYTQNQIYRFKLIQFIMHNVTYLFVFF